MGICTGLSTSAKSLSKSEYGIEFLCKIVLAGNGNPAPARGHPWSCRLKRTASVKAIGRKRRIPIHGQIIGPFRRRERGVTILIVAVAMMAMFAMAALAIDIVTLYVSEGEAQTAADATALAGAKVFVSSGFTSGQLGDPTLSTAQNLVCNGSTGLADLQAQAVANHNLVAGTAPTSG